MAKWYIRSRPVYLRADGKLVYIGRRWNVYYPDYWKDDEPYKICESWRAAMTFVLWQIHFHNLKGGVGERN